MADEIKIEPVVNPKEEIEIGVNSENIVKDKKEIKIEPITNPKQ